VDARGYVDLAYDHKFGSDGGVAARVYYDGYRYTGVYPYASTVAGQSILLNKDVSNGQWGGATFAVSKRLFDSQTLIFGSEYEYNFEQFQTNFDEQPYFQYFSSRPTSSLWAVYLQDEIPLWSNLTFSLGLRYDRYSTFGGTTNPRAALIYQPFEMTTVKLLYGQSFRPPNAYEQYYEGAGQEGNPNLQPERVKTMELVLEQYFQGGIRMLASGYYYPIRNLISSSTDPANGNIIFENGPGANLRGLEISLKKQAHSGLEIGGSLSLQKGSELGSQSVLTNSPRLLSQASLSVPLFRKKLFASADANYVSRRVSFGGEYAGAYFLPNFTLLSRSFRRWDVSFSLYNAFNMKYSDPAAIGDPEDLIVQNGRTLGLRIMYHP
jgi:iron complex outermembrane receptor protein